MTALRGHANELDADRLGGFHVRWYAHNAGHLAGPFLSMEELADYMACHGLPGPDEFLAPIEQEGW
ncbi:hypothetical protein DT019_02890 [Streptomyces sp. SDr-06]|uniref:hypothetical protein n=1 Tax=Streptomyces sp. SDr-06 TaxID=2267702 RepID=UPI000DEA93CF|nr:hypothetical protein [Streptomyces sp. SDr-06]RCH70449.1 hypothetical protein DT019_02890 [Streptomyces sp. SDr-06]